jgi:hypothetical protein
MSAHSKMLIKTVIVTVLLAIMSVCLLGYVLHYGSGIFREFQAAVLSVDWMLVVCLAFWCGSFIYLTFSRADWPLVGLLLIAITAYTISYKASPQAADAIILLMRNTVPAEGRWKMEDGRLGD